MTSTRSRARRSALSIAAAAIVAVLAVFGAAAPASAHDALVSSDPTDGATLEALPAQITLTFNAELLAGSGNEIQVTDAAGTSLSDGAAVVDGTLLTQALAGDAAGTIQVLWRAVSSDGHPISGEFLFAVPDAPAPTPTETEVAPPSASPTSGADEGATPEPTMTILTAPAEESASPLPWIILAVVLVAAAGAVVALLVVRARRGSSGDSGSAPGAER